MMTNRSDEFQEYIETEQQRIAIGERARNDDTEAALEALDEWSVRQYQEMRPPDVERAQELYRNGKVDEQELEVLIESAMEYYPPDGKRENRGKLLKNSTSAADDFVLKVLFIAGIVLLIGLLFIETGQPAADPNIHPL